MGRFREASLAVALVAAAFPSGAFLGVVGGLQAEVRRPRPLACPGEPAYLAALHPADVEASVYRAHPAAPCRAACLGEAASRPEEHWGDGLPAEPFLEPYWGACPDAVAGQEVAFRADEHQGAHCRAAWPQVAPFQAENQDAAAFPVGHLVPRQLLAEPVVDVQASSRVALRPPEVLQERHPEAGRLGRESVPPPELPLDDRVSQHRGLESRLPLQVQRLRQFPPISCYSSTHQNDCRDDRSVRLPREVRCSPSVRVAPSFLRETL